MPLKLRPTGLGHGVYKDNVDYRVLNGEWGISRIDVRFYWSLHGLVLTRRPGMSARLMLLLQPRFGTRRRAPGSLHCVRVVRRLFWCDNESRELSAASSAFSTHEDRGGGRV